MRRHPIRPRQCRVPCINVDFMERDSKRFADSGGWGWAAFNYDAASDTFAPATEADQPPQGMTPSADSRAIR